MPLKVTDTTWSLLRPTDVHSRLSRMTEVSYNNAVLMKPFSSVAADDLPYIHDTTLRLSGAAVGDYVGYTYTTGVKDTAPTTERLYFSWNYRFLDAVAPASKLLVTMRPPAVAEVHAPSDKVLSTIAVLLRDSVTASSSFLSGWQSFLDTVSSGFSSDVFYSTLVAKSPDTVATGDSVVIGIRYPIEAYFGGLAIGGSPFGGRL